jgi:hypothetical protein
LVLNITADVIIITIFFFFFFSVLVIVNLCTILHGHWQLFEEKKLWDLVAKHSNI